MKKKTNSSRLSIFNTPKLKPVLLSVVTILLLTSCGSSKKDIVGKWKVTDLYVAIKDGGYNEDAKNIYGFVWGILEFDFKKDGTVDILDTKNNNTYNGKWNEGKNDEDPIFQFLGKDKYSVVLRWKEGTSTREHMWTTYASYEKSIITEKDKIHTEVTPAIQEGNIGLYLERVK